MLPTDLTLPAPGAASMRRLVAAWLQRTADALLALPLGELPDVPGLADVLPQLAELAADRSDLLAFLHQPQPGVLAKVATLRPWLDPQTRACALRDLLARWPQRHLPPDPALFVPLHPAFARLHLGLSDANPLPIFDYHPTRGGNVVGLAGHDLGEWQSALHDALELIATYLPEIADEMRVGLHLLLPAGYDPEIHQSASYLQSPGTAYLTLHPDQMTLAEAIVHEFQHTKLHYVLDADPLLHDDGQTYASPLRPDARPLRGVLLAVHAFVPVAVLYERMRAASHPLAQRPYFAQRYQQIVQRNQDGWAVLRKHARPTPLGKAVLRSMVGLGGL